MRLMLLRTAALSVLFMASTMAVSAEGFGYEGWGVLITDGRVSAASFSNKCAYSGIACILTVNERLLTAKSRHSADPAFARF